MQIALFFVTPMRQFRPFTQNRLSSFVICFSLSWLFCMSFPSIAPVAYASETVFKHKTLPEPLKKHHLSYPDCALVDDNNLKSSLRFFTYALDKKTELYAIICDGGSYNTSFAIYLVRNKNYHNVERLYFPTFSKKYGWGGQNVLFNASYDPDTHQLTAITKYDAQKDCGNQASYLWVEGRFKLKHYRHKKKCSQKVTQWPLVYQFPSPTSYAQHIQVKTKKPRYKRLSRTKKRLRYTRLKHLKRVRFKARVRAKRRRVLALRRLAARKRRIQRAKQRRYRFKRKKRRRRRRKSNRKRR